MTRGISFLPFAKFGTLFAISRISLHDKIEIFVHEVKKDKELLVKKRRCYAEIEKVINKSHPIEM